MFIQLSYNYKNVFSIYTKLHIFFFFFSYYVEFKFVKKFFLSETFNLLLMIFIKL